MEQLTTGEAANMEIALLLDLTGERAPVRLASRLAGPSTTDDRDARTAGRELPCGDRRQEHR
jgi:hypothetical protein